MSEPFNIPLSAETNDKFKKWAAKFDVNEEYILRLYARNFEKTRDEKKARILTMGNLEEEFGSLLSNAPFWYVYILRDSGVVDIYELMRQKAKNMLEDTNRSQEALDKQMITPDGVPLDYRQKVFGKENPNFGLPLTGSSYSRSIFAIVSPNSDFSGAIFGELTAKDEFAKTLDSIVEYNFYKVRANQNKKIPNRFSLLQGNKFMPIETDITSAELANQIVTEPLDSLELIFQSKFIGKKNTSYLVPLRGNIARVAGEFRGALIFILYDDMSETKVRCRISTDIPIVFKESDEILSFNRLYTGKDGRIAVDTRAYMVI